MKDSYTSLKKELTVISELIKLFPESIHQKVFDILITEYQGVEPSLPSDKPSGKEAKTGKNELAGIARLDEKGNFHFTVRDPKANSQSEAVKRLTYVAIRSYLILHKDETSVSRKKIVNPILRDWRVYDGNARPWLANDKGILRDGDAFSLDKHATDEADKFINDILDTNVTGSWKPGSSTKRRPKSSDKQK